MQRGPYSICTDGSNDNSIKKMFPITVTVELGGAMVTRFLDMCTGTSGTAEGKPVQEWVESFQNLSQTQLTLLFALLGLPSLCVCSCVLFHTSVVHYFALVYSYHTFHYLTYLFPYFVAMYNNMKIVLDKFEVPLSNCVSLGVDNTNSNVGAHNSLKTRILMTIQVCLWPDASAMFFITQLRELLKCIRYVLSLK